VLIDLFFTVSAHGLALSFQNLSWAAVAASTAKAKLAGMWREKVDQHNTGAVYERIERVIVERADEQPTNNSDLPEANFDEAPKLTNSQKPWWAD
jgi:hypothetical protein